MNQNNTEIFELDSQYSTTRRVMRISPVIVNNPEDKIHSALFLPENPDRKAEGGLRTQGYFKNTQIDKPLISVITVVFNGAEYLEQTINSVIEQTYGNVEYIIIDGGSTDGTLDIIKKYEGQVDYWVSERDKGIADAFNKGISLCTAGCWINILNSGDFYASATLFLDILNLFSTSKIVTGYSQYLNSKKLIPNRVLGNSELLPLKAMISHQASFVSIDIYKKFGGYNNTYKVRMDYELWSRVLKENSFHFIPEVFVHYLPYGESYKSVDKFIIEGVKVNFRHMNFLYAIFFSVVLISKQSVKYVLRQFYATY